jgi:hypothetical protein
VKVLDGAFELCQTLCMTVTTKGVRFTSDDMKLLEAVQCKLGCRSVSEVVRMGLRSIAREQGVTVTHENPKTEKQDKKS